MHLKTNLIHFFSGWSYGFGIYDVCEFTQHVEKLQTAKSKGMKQVSTVGSVKVEEKNLKKKKEQMNNRPITALNLVTATILNDKNKT